MLHARLCIAQVAVHRPRKKAECSEAGQHEMHILVATVFKKNRAVRCCAS